jgi:hypothetical protein
LEHYNGTLPINCLDSCAHVFVVGHYFFPCWGAKLL